jgi:hypothetical protein
MNLTTEQHFRDHLAEDRQVVATSRVRLRRKDHLYWHGPGELETRRGAWEIGVPITMALMGDCDGILRFKPTMLSQIQGKQSGKPPRAPMSKGSQIQ